MATGGGWLDGGLVGEYFANTGFTGASAYSRRDIRIDFDWGNLARPGGSLSPGYADVGADNYSIRWSGRLMPRYSETYTFHASADDAFKLEIRPAGTTTWTTVLNQTADTGTETLGTMALTAGETYDIRIEYQELAGSAHAKLRWSSPSTPPEVIDTTTELGFNVAGSWRQAFTDIVKGARNSWEGIDALPRPAMDANGWPMGDGAYVWQESLNQGLGLDPMQRGRISFSFNGRAQVELWGNWQSGTPSSSYDAATNTTTGSFISQDRNINASYFRFRNTDRDGNYGADALPDRDGITNLRLMKPTAPDSNTSFAATSLFQPELRDTLMNYFTTLRVDLNNGNQESVWSDRTLPAFFNQSNGKETTRIYSTGDTKSNGASWEHRVMLANESGRDLYINLPMAVTGWDTSQIDSYVFKLAQLIRYGSDGVNPYTSPQANPVYPPLNPNLRVYIELSNEYWNFGGDAFRQYWDLDAMVTADADAYLTGSSTDPRARAGDFQILNYDNRSTAKNTSGAYNELATWRARKMVLRTVQISNIFRHVYGDDAMQSQVRPVYMWQYENANNTASNGLNFLEAFFNNGDGVQYVLEPHEPSYYIFGGGGATYYGSGNEWGVTDQMPNPSFETPVLPNGYSERPANAGWVFTGTAGIARDGGSGDDIPPGWQSSQVAYLTGTGAMERTFTLPATQTSNVYSVSFKAVQRGTNTQKFSVLIDGQAANARSYSQSGGYQPAQWDSGSPWYSNVVSWTRSAYYQTITFTGTPGSTHTVRFEGLNAGQTAFIDDVRLSSVDAIFEGGMPSGGAFAAGQTPSGVYTDRLNVQASWAAAFGLAYTTYEGGWACGGDTGGSPLQNHAKYIDPRASSVNIDALHRFDRTGGFLNTMGTYAQWPSWSDSTRSEGLLAMNTWPLMQAQLAYLADLPRPVDNGHTLAGSKTLSYTQRAINHNSNNARINNKGWISWNVIAPVAGEYNIAVNASAGGTLQLIVDGEIVASYPSAQATVSPSQTVQLSAGMHTIRVRSMSGAFDVPSITVSEGVGGEVTALAAYEGAGLPAGSASLSPAAIAAGATVSAITLGTGLKTQTSFANGLLVVPTDNVWATSLDNATNQNEYFQFTAAPAAGRFVSIAGISMQVWAQNGRTFSVGLRYSTDGTIFSTGLVNSGVNSATSFDLSQIAALQNFTGTATFRVYFFSGINSYETAGIGNRSGNDLVLHGSVAMLPAAPAVESIAVNDGGAQRSMVTSVTYTFASEVTVDDGAFSLLRRGDTVPVELLVDPSTDGRTWVLRFTGAGVVADSLADGTYDLTSDAGKIRDIYGQMAVASGPFTLHRLFGDANGDAKVDMADNRQFVGALGSVLADLNFRWYFDVNGDDKVDMADNRQLLARLGL